MHKNTGKMPVPPRVWLDENYDRIIRDNNEFQEKMNYIINNPVKANLVETANDYKWLYIFDSGDNLL
jgi:hypothetical protein